MKTDSIASQKTKKKPPFYAPFYLWPSAIAAVMMVFVEPVAAHTWPIFSLLTPWLSLLIFLPFTIVEVRRHRSEAAREKRDLQAKYDAQDKAMFGKPLREIEL